MRAHVPSPFAQHMGHPEKEFGMSLPHVRAHERRRNAARVSPAPRYVPCPEANQRTHRRIRMVNYE